MWEDYYRPRTLIEALEILERYAGEARVIAGGTDLLLDLRRGTKRVKYLVDIRHIEGMNSISLTGDIVHIGAAVTHSSIATSPLIRKKAPALAEAASQVGSSQVRNVGTIAGNIVNAQPAADVAVALLALEARVEIVSYSGESRTAFVEDLYEGPGVSSVDSTKSIVTRVIVPVHNAGESSVFLRVAGRKALALPILNLCAVVGVENGRIASVCISSGPIGPTPRRLRNVEKRLLGEKPTLEKLRYAAEAASSEANPRSSPLRGSREFRQNLLATLLVQGICIAANRASRNGEYGFHGGGAL